jgi:hypothetical protein
MRLFFLPAARLRFCRLHQSNSEDVKPPARRKNGAAEESKSRFLATLGMTGGRMGGRAAADVAEPKAPGTSPRGLEAPAFCRRVTKVKRASETPALRTTTARLWRLPEIRALRKPKSAARAKRKGKRDNRQLTQTAINSRQPTYSRKRHLTQPISRRHASSSGWTGASPGASVIFDSGDYFSLS